MNNFNKKSSYSTDKVLSGKNVNAVKKKKKSPLTSTFKGNMKTAKIKLVY